MGFTVNADCHRSAFHCIIVLSSGESDKSLLELLDFVILTNESNHTFQISDKVLGKTSRKSEELFKTKTKNYFGTKQPSSSVQLNALGIMEKYTVYLLTPCFDEDITSPFQSYFQIVGASKCPFFLFSFSTQFVFVGVFF